MFGIPEIDASCHVLPPSRVTLIIPLFVPTHSMPAATGEPRIDSIAPPGGVNPPAVDGVGGASARMHRSGLIAVQCAPLSVVVQTDWNAAMSICWFHGAKMIGWDDVVRRRRDGSTAGLTLIHCSVGYVMRRMPDPLAYTVLGSSGSGTMVPHSQPDTGFQSIGVMAPRLPRTRVRIAPASCCVP